MKKRPFRERSRYIIIISILLILVNATLGVFLIKLSQEAIITQIEGRMLDIANTAADMLDGNKLKRLTKDDVDSPDYHEGIRTLTGFQSNIELQYIYCIQIVGEKEFAFSIDPTIEDPGEFGEPIVYTDALYQASLGTPAVDKVPYEDRWGSFYSAYSPVFDSIGNVACIVGVDFSADWYNEQVNKLVRTVLIVCAVSLLLGGLVVFVITEHTRRRNRQLYAELNSLADNVEDLVTEVSHTTHTEHSTRIGSDSQTGGDDIRDLSDKIQFMQDELRTEIAHVHRMAYIDALTGISNTAAYMKMANLLDQQIQAGTAVFSVAAFDLNGLKQINDHYGHDSGDNALIDAAGVICRVFGKESVYRVGGDEFMAVILTGSGEEMDELFSRFDRELEEENNKEKSYHFPLSISKGYSIYQKGDPDYKTVSHRADVIMYQDKDAYYEQNGNPDRR